MDECLFCKIVAGRESSYKIAESKNFVAFLNIFPATSAHTLIIPKSHATNLLDLPEHFGSELLEFSQRVAQAVMACVGADGFNFSLNNGVSAGQAIGHTHFHIVPRKRNDGLHSSLDVNHPRAAPQELVEHQRDLLARLLSE
jgi:histidine triad (HIT) family protein